MFSSRYGGLAEKGKQIGISGAAAMLEEVSTKVTKSSALFIFRTDAYPRLEWGLYTRVDVHYRGNTQSWHRTAKETMATQASK
jgi:hypothetical protein